MCAIRLAGKINENTTLIDIGMEDVHGMTAVYLIRGSRTCLIDGGTSADGANQTGKGHKTDGTPRSSQ